MTIYMSIQKLVSCLYTVDHQGFWTKDIFVKYKPLFRYKNTKYVLVMKAWLHIQILAVCIQSLFNTKEKKQLVHKLKNIA